MSAEAPPSMDLGAPDAEPVPGLERDFPGDDNGSGAKAVYDAGGDTRAAFDRFNEDYPESDESSDFDDDYEDSDAPMDLLGDGGDRREVAPAATVEFAVDEDDAPLPFLDAVVKSMRAEEVAVVAVRKGVVDAWGDDADVYEMTVTLKSFVKQPVGHEMDDDDAKKQHVAGLKANGNGWFKKGDLARAKRRYEAAVYFGEYEDCCKDDVPAIRGNLAMVAISSKDWHGAVASCDKVIAADASNVKAWYRRGVACGELKDFDKSALKDVAAKRKAAKAAEKATYGGMFAKLSGFASENRPNRGRRRRRRGAFDDDEDDWEEPPNPVAPIVHATGLTRCFFDISIGGERPGTITFELFDDTVPKTANNFLSLCLGDNDKKLTYKGCAFHRIIKGFMCQGGDMTKGDGTGGESVYGGKFDDEAFVDNHDAPGLLSMANAGKNTNGSHGMDVVSKLEDVAVDDASKPKKPCVIDDCGELPPAEAPKDDEAASLPDAENESDAP
ncbi:peptidyl-prolyl cis-trans isomerase [Aureococcus anophagefferens]|nr:peptidyl-prolyl cis-trans isomerase [Aureococcus anophagefferens]